jgi:hypothetical protein
MTCALLGLYALSSRRRAGAVGEDGFDRCCVEEEEAERKGTVGVECLRWRSHSSALSRGTRSQKKKLVNFFFFGGRGEKEIDTNLVQHKHELLPLLLPPPHRLLHEPTPTALGIPRVQHEKDDVALVDHLVQRAEVVLSGDDDWSIRCMGGGVYVRWWWWWWE